MYLLGIKAYYPELVEVCGMTLRPASRNSNRAMAYSGEFLLSCVDRCGDLNDNVMLQKLIDKYETIGNVIAVWPGANVHRGQFGCYDCPDIYFNDEKIKAHAIWFFSQSDNNYVLGNEYIINGEYEGIDVLSLSNIQNTEYEKYILHALKIISDRNEKLQRELVEERRE